MASPTDIRKGKVIIYNGIPHAVTEMLHRTQGRQAGFVQCTLRNLHNNATTTTKFRSTDSVEFCHTESKDLEFSYIDDQGYHFMDPETFDDIVLPANLCQEAKEFLVETNSYSILYVDDKPISVELPNALEMTVIESPDAVRGDTASNVQKPVTVETGLIVQVPLFIKKGEVIRVATEDGSYLGRA